MKRSSDPWPWRNANDALGGDFVLHTHSATDVEMGPSATGKNRVFSYTSGRNESHGGNFKSG